MQTKQIIHMLNKYKLKPISALILMVGFVLAWTAPIHAKTQLVPSSQQPIRNTTVTLEMMGYPDRTLRGESFTARYPLNIPETWELEPGGEINLQLNSVFYNGENSTTPNSLLEISFNDMLLDQHFLTRAGTEQITLEIPAEALTPNRDDGRHQLIVRLLNESFCNDGSEARVTISADSELTLPHTLVEPTTDLTKLPSPIFHRSFMPSQALLVIPDNPSAEEFSAALTIAAAFGRFSEGNMSLPLVHEAALTSELRGENHLIFVGMADSFTAESGLAEVDFPASWQNGTWTATSAGSEDGVIQIGLSPWQDEKVVLAISGDTETAVSKAAQAVGLGPVQVGLQPNLAVVEKAMAEVTNAQELPPLEQTIADAGYETLTYEGENNEGPLLTFYVPASHVPTSDAYFDLVYNHSAMVDYANSGLLVRLNDELVGSVLLSDASTIPGTARIALPPSAMQSGRNVLSFESELNPLSECNRFDESGVWFTVRPESTLHLPLVPGEKQTVNAATLSQYPHAFMAERPLTQTAFILAAADNVARETAAALAFDMGKEVSTGVTAPTALYANDVQPEAIAEHDLFIIGQPDTLPILAELADTLPVPFLPESNQLNDAYLDVVYQGLADKDTAFLELLAAPWENGRSILAVLGNSDEAVRLAGAALINPDLRDQLQGNFAIWDDNQLVVDIVQPREGAAASAQNNLPASDTSFTYEPPSWIMPVLGAALLLMVLIALYAIFAALKRRRRA